MVCVSSSANVKKVPYRWHVPSLGYTIHRSICRLLSSYLVRILLHHLHCFRMLCRSCHRLLLGTYWRVRLDLMQGCNFAVQPICLEHLLIPAFALTDRSDACRNNHRRSSCNPSNQSNERKLLRPLRSRSRISKSPLLSRLDHCINRHHGWRRT